MKYLIWSIEHNGWWKPNCTGYTSWRMSAGRYELDEAHEICKGANGFREVTQPPMEAIVPDLWEGK